MNPTAQSLLSRLTGVRRVLLVMALLVVALAAYLMLRSDRVTVVLAERGELRQAVVASGRVRTPQRVDIASQITGRVLAVEVREGATVLAGQTLVRLDPAESLANVAQAQASLRANDSRLHQLGELGQTLAEQTLQQAQANALQARRQYARVEELVAQGFYSPAQLDDAKRAQAIADSQQRAAQLQLTSNQPGGSEAQIVTSNVAQARAALAVAEARLAYATLRAPADGRVLSRGVEPGDTVQPGKVLLSFAPTGDTELSVQIDEKNLGLLALGQTALVSADAYPGQRFAAQLSTIAPSVDPQRGSVEVRLRVAQPPTYLKAEMTVSIDIEAARRSDVVTVPTETLRDADSAQPWIMVLRDGKTSRQPVRLGLRGGGRTEILEGIAAGDALLPAANPLDVGRRVVVRSP